MIKTQVLQGVVFTYFDVTWAAVVLLGLDRVQTLSLMLCFLDLNPAEDDGCNCKLTWFTLIDQSDENK